MPYSISLIRKVEKMNPDVKDVLWGILDELEQQREQSVTRKDFQELREIVRELGHSTRDLATGQKQTELIVKELAEAQKRTEVKVEELAEAQKRTEVKIEELAEAQKRTEVKVEELAEAQKRTEVKVEELAEAQTRTEVKVEELAEAQKRTEVKVEELAEAQKRTEVKVEELAEAQKRTEVKVEELAEAQTRTEVKIEELAEAQTRTEGQLEEMAKEVGKLAKSLKNTRSQVGGLAQSVAYALENEAYRKLPAYLKQVYQIDVRERFVRRDIQGNEVNLFAHAVRNSEDVLLIGETVLKFDDGAKMRKLEEKVVLARQTFSGPIIPLLITHYAVPNLREKAQDKGVIVVQSFEWE